MARKLSLTAIRLLAESSNVRSNHWVEAVIAGFITLTSTRRAKEQMRSERMGLRL